MVNYKLTDKIKGRNIRAHFDIFIEGDEQPIRLGFNIDGGVTNKEGVIDYIKFGFIQLEYDLWLHLEKVGYAEKTIEETSIHKSITKIMEKLNKGDEK